MDKEGEILNSKGHIGFKKLCTKGQIITHHLMDQSPHFIH